MAQPLGVDLCAECEGYGVDGSGSDCYLCDGTGRRLKRAVAYRSSPLRYQRHTIWSPLLCDPATIERMTEVNEEPDTEEDAERLWSLKLSCGHVQELYTFIGDFNYAKMHEGLKQICWECNATKGFEHMMVDLVSAEVIQG